MSVVDIFLLFIFFDHCRVLVHMVHEVNAVDKTNILQSYVKVCCVVSAASVAFEVINSVMWKIHLKLAEVFSHS